MEARGEHAFNTDPAPPLAFDTLSNRGGEVSTRLVATDPTRFNAPIWSQAARNRDFVVHHYDRIDNQALWNAISVSFPHLQQLLNEIQHVN